MARNNRRPPMTRNSDRLVEEKAIRQVVEFRT
jgi:hypothetical protein